MGVEKEVFYSVRCDRCGSLLEDYAGELARLTQRRYLAEKTARQYGFIQTNSNKWLCPGCANQQDGTSDRD